MKKELQNDMIEDIDKIRGALREILDHNRVINRSLVESFTEGDLSMLEEYGLLSKGIIDAAKLLTEVNSQVPKTLHDIDKVKEEKQKINLDDLIEN
jgi:excinuclease UvrABC helicase subunit UvrB